jgi:hypothetical protein
MLKNIDRWFAFARRLGLGIEQMEDIILVTGCDRARSWTNVAFLGSHVDAQVSFGVEVVDRPSTSIKFRFSPEHLRGAVWNPGPEGTVRQCFVRKGRWTRDSFGMTLLLIRTYPRINVYLSEDFVLLVPSEYCQGILKLRQVPPRIQSTTVSQTWN